MSKKIFMTRQKGNLTCVGRPFPMITGHKIIIYFFLLKEYFLSANILVFLLRGIIIFFHKENYLIIDIFCSLTLKRLRRIQNLLSTLFLFN